MFFMRMLTHPMEINMAGEDIDNRDQGIANDTTNREDKRERNRDQTYKGGYNYSTIDSIGEMRIKRLATSKHRVTTAIPPVQGDQDSNHNKMQAIDNQYNFLLRLIGRIKTIGQPRRREWDQRNKQKK